MSDGVYASLNLGALTDDLAANVEENRRLACAEIGADPHRLTLNRQVHSATVHEAVAGRRGALLRSCPPIRGFAPDLLLYFAAQRAPPPRSACVEASRHPCRCARLAGQGRRVAGGAK